MGDNRVYDESTVHKNPEQPYYLRHEHRYTAYQNKLYRRALKGLQYYEPDEIRLMHRSKRKRIRRVYERAQMELNLLKQEYMHKVVVAAFTTYCNIKDLGKNAIAFLEAYSEPDPDFLCTLPLKDLGITKPLVVERFIQKGILPRNFYKLTTAPDA